MSFVVFVVILGKNPACVSHGHLKFSVVCTIHHEYLEVFQYKTSTYHKSCIDSRVGYICKRNPVSLTVSL